MATLQSTTSPSIMVNTIRDNGGVAAFDTSFLDSESRRLRKAHRVASTTSFDVGTGWSVRTELSEQLNGFKAGSYIHLFYYVPNRNNSTSWGGAYIEPQVEFNNDGVWFSLGCCGYDGGVMIYRHATIASYMTSIIIDPNQSNDFSVKFRFAMRSYDGTTTINGSHNINNVSGTASIMGGNNGLQHYFHIVVKEYSLWH